MNSSTLTHDPGTARGLSTGGPEIRKAGGTASGAEHFLTVQVLTIGPVLLEYNRGPSDWYQGTASLPWRLVRIRARLPSLAACNRKPSRL